MEDAQSLDVAVGGDRVGNAMVPVQKHPNRRTVLVRVADLWEFEEDFGALVDAEDGPVRRFLIVFAM